MTKRRMSPRLKARRGRFGSPLPVQFRSPGGGGAPAPAPGGSGQTITVDNFILTQKVQ